MRFILVFVHVYVAGGEARGAALVPGQDGLPAQPDQKGHTPGGDLLQATQLPSPGVRYRKQP